MLIELDPTISTAEVTHIPQRPARRQARRGAPARLAGRGRRSGEVLRSAARRGPHAAQHAAQPAGESADGAEVQALGARQAEEPEGSRADHDPGDDREARDDHPLHPAARRDPPAAERQGARLEAHPARDHPAAQRVPPGPLGAAQEARRGDRGYRRRHPDREQAIGEYRRLRSTELSRGRAQVDRPARRPDQGRAAHEAADADLAGRRRGAAARHGTLSAAWSRPPRR